MGLVELVKANEEKSNEHLDAVKDGPLDFDFVYEHMSAVVLYRYLLNDEELDTEDLKELGELSVRKTLKMQRDEDLEELSMTCTGQSSSGMKKVLLMILIRKHLGFMWDPVESANVETLTQLAERVIVHLTEVRAGGAQE